MIDMELEEVEEIELYALEYEDCETATLYAWHYDAGYPDIIGTVETVME